MNMKSLGRSGDLEEWWICRTLINWAQSS